MMFWIAVLILLSGTSLARESLPTKSPPQFRAPHS